MTYCMTFLFSKKVKRIKGRWWVEDLHDSLSLFYLKSRSSLLLFNPLNDDRGQKSKNPKIFRRWLGNGLLHTLLLCQHSPTASKTVQGAEDKGNALKVY